MERRGTTDEREHRRDLLVHRPSRLDRARFPPQWGRGRIAGQRHFSILRAAIEATAGREVKNLGDGLMVVFLDSRPAPSPPRSKCSGIERHNRRSDIELRVRVGLATGEASEEDGDFFGDPVTEAARLSAEANGGQILATELLRLTVGRPDSVHRVSPPWESWTSRACPQPWRRWKCCGSRHRRQVVEMVPRLRCRVAWPTTPAAGSSAFRGGRASWPPWKSRRRDPRPKQLRGRADLRRARRRQVVPGRSPGPPRP